MTHYLVAACAVGSTLIALSANGQQGPQAPQAAAADQQELQEIVVTGSMIKRTDAETAEAITVISIDSLKAQGITSVEQALTQISANQSTFNTASNVSTFGGGSSFAGLRGLGQSKTLVLLDGQRLADAASPGNGNAVDINLIPWAAIDHIEVLREGASSLYGTDAIAGVINFITKKNYEGGEVNVNYDHPEHPGGSSGDADLTYGIGNLASDGYNFMVTGNYTQQKEMTASQRPYASTGYNPALGLENLNGPTGPWPGSYFDGVGNLWQVGYPTCAGNPHLAAVAGSCEYLYSAAVDLVPKSDSQSILSQFTKSLGDNNKLTLQYFWSRFNLTTWGGPQEYSFTMDPTSPYYPTAAESTCFGTCTTGTPVLGGPITAGWTDPNNNRYFGNVNTQQRGLATFSHDGGGGWDYALNFNWSLNKTNESVRGGEANYAVLAPGGVLSNLINPFGPQSAAGQALINSAYMNGDLAVGRMFIYSLNGQASHVLGDAFGAGRPAQLALGFDVRDEQMDYNPTPLATTLYPATYYSVETITGSRTEEAAFLELNVPVTKEFDFTISDRQDRYSDFGTTNNGKVSFTYEPISAVKFRGAASTGFRAPSLINLYQPNTLGATAGTMNGPGCASGNYNTEFSQLVCSSQGLGVYGGNPNLKPETSQNFDLGVVLEPINNLGVTIDYYRIIIKNEIQAIPDQAIYGNPTAFADLINLNKAGTFTPAPLANTQCSNAIPDYSAPTCGWIYQTFQNTGGITTDGFDVNVQYLVNSDFGKFHFSIDGSFVTEYQLQTYTGGPELNLVGQFNEGFQPVIRWQHTMNLDWSYQKWGAGLTNHFIEHYTDYFPDAAGNLLTVGNYSVWSGYVSYKPVPALTLLAGIRNLFDTNPPFSNQPLNWQSGYNPVFSDPYGRTFYGKVTFTF